LKLVKRRQLFISTHNETLSVVATCVGNPDCSRRSTRTLQDGESLALLHFVQQVTRFHCGLRSHVDTAILINQGISMGNEVEGERGGKGEHGKEEHLKGGHPEAR